MKNEERIIFLNVWSYRLQKKTFLYVCHVWSTFRRAQSINLKISVKLKVQISKHSGWNSKDVVAFRIMTLSHYLWAAPKDDTKHAQEFFKTLFVLQIISKEL